jgi:hypothetical protein
MEQRQLPSLTEVDGQYLYDASFFGYLKKIESCWGEQVGDMMRERDVNRNYLRRIYRKDSRVLKQAFEHLNLSELHRIMTESDSDFMERRIHYCPFGV